MKLNDLLAIGLLLTGINLFINSIKEFSIFGLAGSTILIIVEVVFLFQFFRRKG